MPSDTLDFGHRAHLTEIIDKPCPRDELRSCLRDVARLNRWFLGYRPTLEWLESVAPVDAAQPVCILDVGCGYGDGLRRIDRWAKARRISVELTGIDINADAVAIAAEATPPASGIRWIAADVFAFTPSPPVDFVVSALFTHHLAENDVIHFVQWMERHAKRGWFINDLSRAAAPYHLLRLFSKIARLHPFVQHDGPVSIARAFVPEDWKRMCSAAGLNDHGVSIKAFTPARLCVARSKPQ
jgi:SAM-dependent methyltransferase